MSRQTPDPRRHDRLRQLPKVELHRHLEGSLRLETLLEVAQQRGLAAPVHSIEAMRTLVTMAGQRGDYRAYLDRFHTLRQFFRSLDVIWRFAYEAVADAAADNVRYLELRFTPRALGEASGAPYEAVTDCVCEAVARAAADHGITARLIISMNRHEAVEIGEAVTRVAVDRQSQGVVGLDIAGNEVEFPARPFGSLLVQAQQAGLGVTIHAGEWDGPQSVRDAIENWSAQRIGHGVRVMEDPAVAQLAYERGVAFEICPTSNVQSGVARDISSHPLRAMYRTGLRVTLNTDNTCVSDVTLSREMATVMEGLGFNLGDIRQMVRTAAESAFLPENERQALCAELAGALAQLPDTV